MMNYILIFVLSVCLIRAVVPVSNWEEYEVEFSETENVIETIQEIGQQSLITKSAPLFNSQMVEGSSHVRKSTSSKHVIPDKLKDKTHGIKMGIPWHECDDGYSKITNDWDGSEADYTCYRPTKNLPLTIMTNSTEICVTRPFYMPAHWCMFHKIEYGELIPYYGDHRPLWPKFGEYDYLPPQRWLHSLEHGAIIFFYHPCARPDLVQRIKSILISCLRKYVIAKNANLDESAPFLLLAWGCKNFMSGVDEKDIVRFIREHAMTAPESHTIRQGWYDWNLIMESVNPPFGSDINESNICPTYPPETDQEAAPVKLS